VLAVVLSVAGTLLFGTILPATQVLSNQTSAAARSAQEQSVPQVARGVAP
jgi:hypothetical protein